MTWHPVTEKPPKPGVYVTAYRPTGLAAMKMILAETEYATAWYSEAGEWCHPYFPISEMITHWIEKP